MSWVIRATPGNNYTCPCKRDKGSLHRHKEGRRGEACHVEGEGSCVGTSHGRLAAAHPRSGPESPLRSAGCMEVLVSQSRTFVLQNCEREVAVVVSHWIHGNLLWWH